MTDDNTKFSCCFTGHRHVPYECESRLRTELKITIEELLQKGCCRFISGGAVGFDIMAAEVITELKKNHSNLTLVMALPCKNQHKKWGSADKNRLEKVLADADEVIYLCESYCTGCMHLRNKYLVNNSRICIAYMTHRGGGTEYTVNYAREKELELINLAYRL